jgi:hypothetical protein
MKKKLPNHAEFSAMVRTKTLSELRTLYYNVAALHGGDSGPACLVAKHIHRMEKDGG